VECQKDDRAGTRIRIETVSLQKRKNEDEEQDFIKISNCILYHAAIESIADIYISISMGTFGHRKYKSRGEDGNK